MAPPNILLLMTDQQRWDSLGVYGAPEACTPNLDRLARQGVRFDNAYCNNPICTPSRASMLTGGELPDHGVMRLEDVLDDAQVLLPERLREQGYQTALFGKLHVSRHTVEARQRHPHDGFDVYEWCHEPAIHVDSPFNGYARWLAENDPTFLDELRQKGRGVGHFPYASHATHWTAEAVTNFLRGQSGERPFFCLASIFDPHDPYDDYPDEFAARVPESCIRQPIRGPDDGDGDPSSIRTERAMNPLAPVPDAPARVTAMRRGYHTSIALMDQEFGRILDCLEETGLAANTLVIFTSDHGDMLGDHRLMGKGAAFYEPCTRVPLLVRWPGKIVGGRALSGFVQLNDLAATLCEAAGMEPEALAHAMPAARSLLPWLSGREPASPRTQAICAYRHTGYSRAEGGNRYVPVSGTMIRQEHYKLCLYHDEVTGNLAAEGQLFDLSKDPDELCNIWTEPALALVRERLTRQVLDWISTREGGLTRFATDVIPD